MGISRRKIVGETVTRRKLKTGEGEKNEGERKYEGGERVRDGSILFYGVREPRGV